MGSEMCIRDRDLAATARGADRGARWATVVVHHSARRHCQPPGACLLYTSDAADERSSVDLGGRRLITKNT